MKKFILSLIAGLALMVAPSFCQTTTYQLNDTPQSLGRAFGNDFRTFNVSFDGADIFWMEGQTSVGYKSSCGTLAPGGNGTGFLYLDPTLSHCINATSFATTGNVVNGRCSGPASITEKFDGFDADNTHVTGTVNLNLTYVYKSGSGRGGGGAGCQVYAIGGSLTVNR